MDLRNKVCLITGGSGGIGAATALALARQGADIAVLGRRADARLEALQTQVQAAGRRFHSALGDAGDATACLRFVEGAAAALGRADVLVHCAGAAAPGGLFEVSSEEWYRAFDVHVHAIFHLCRAVVPEMRRAGAGAIVLISSAAGLRGCAGALAYGVVKGAIPQFARALARELAGDHIRVNAVAPGVIRTPFQDFLTPAQVRNNIENRIPLRREGTPDDVADAIAMLIANEFITGETLTIDGGMTMRVV
jgi:NAD(P)-dependent dehydrogenase (short-subunit alcohol dehydrogenase family)